MQPLYAPAHPHSLPPEHYSGPWKHVDLGLAPHLQPLPFSFKTASLMDLMASADSWKRVQEDERKKELENAKGGSMKSLPRLAPALGTGDSVYSAGDSGLFGTVMAAWANHWSLRTTPEDWWQPFLTRITRRICLSANEPAVRNFFVGWQGKKELCCKVPASSKSSWLQELNMPSFIANMCAQIKGNIRQSGVLEAVASDFSTTLPSQLLCSQLTLMHAMQPYFEYHMIICVCGLHSLEMGGTEQDWARLGEKLTALEALLEPLESTLKLSGTFSMARRVFGSLLQTYTDGPSMHKFWDEVIIKGKEYEELRTGLYRQGTGKQVSVEFYNGWLVEFLTGESKLKIEKLKAGGYAKQLTCLTSCPITITMQQPYIWATGPKTAAMLVGGMTGFHMHPATKEGEGGERRITLQPAHGWCLLLPAEPATGGKVEISSAEVDSVPEGLGTQKWACVVM